jgi:hypothetical protein
MVIMNWECRSDLCQGFRAKDIVICIYRPPFWKRQGIIDRQAFPDAFPLQTVWAESAFADMLFVQESLQGERTLKRSWITSSALASTEIYLGHLRFCPAVRAELQQKLTL